MSKDILLLGFPEYSQQARCIAAAAGLSYSHIKIHHFPDGESQLILPAKLPKHVIFCRSLNEPNEKLIELIMAASSARKNGAQTIGLIAPYLCYMRQDKAFNPGEVVSQIILGELLATYFDQVLTVDAHLHRTEHLFQALPVKKAVNVTATQPMAQFIEKNIDDAYIIGPDKESEQWVANIARYSKLNYCIASKQRFGDKEVEVTIPDADYFQRHIILVDDVASTGKTLLAVAQKLAKYQPASISVLVTHALFVNDAQEELIAANVSNIWSCDSIPHPSNAIQLANLLAGELIKMIELD